MSHDDPQTTRVTAHGVTRRNFIKGVIAGGVAVSSAAYLFRSNPLSPARRPGRAASNG